MQQILGFHLFVLLLLMVVNFCAFIADIHSISTARNAWVGDLVCLCVMEDRSYAEQWMVEGATTLMKVCGMDGRR
jgi:hypothetical protein